MLLWSRSCSQKDWIVLCWSRLRSQKRFKILVNVHLDDVSSNAEPFTAKLGVAMHHYELDIFFQKDWFAVFKVKVTVKDHIIKIWLSNMFSELLILLQVNLVRLHIIISWNVL